MLRIVLTGHSPVLPKECLAPLASDGHAVESLRVDELESWRPATYPCVVVFGLSSETTTQLPEVVDLLAGRSQVSLLVCVSDPADPTLWRSLRDAHIHATVASTATPSEVFHRLAAASDLRRLDDLAQLSADKLDRVRQTLHGFRTVDMDTGLANRRALIQRLGEMLNLSQRYKRPLSLVGFRVTNHDKLLGSRSDDEISEAFEEIADELQLAQRASDLAARVHPNFFALMLPETPLDGAQIVATRMGQLLNDREYCYGIRLAVATAAATAEEGETDPRVLLAMVEDATNP